MLDFDDLIESPHFWILTGIGYVAFFIVLIELNMMGYKEIMSFWVKIVTMLLIPVIAWAFAEYSEG